MKIFYAIIKWAVYISAGLISLVFICILTYKTYLRNKTKIKTPSGISSLEEITLGSIKQWIFIRGTDKKNPVLIFLHGGPGAPMGGISSSRIYDTELINHFTVVHWDQRGAGKSFNRNIPISSMTFDRFVEDCNELIDYVLNKFNTQKVFLIGHSGGSVIGLKTACKYPDKIYAYVGIGQIISEHKIQQIGYDFIVENAKKSRDVKIQNAIAAIGPPPYDDPKEMLENAKYIVQYGGFIRDNPIKHLMAVQLTFLTSPEYTLSEGIRTFQNKGVKFTMDAMWKEIMNINFIEEIKSISIPIYFFHGKYDMITSLVPVEIFYNNLDAKKGKKLIIFENSGHIPFIEEKKKYQELLINIVLKESQFK
jgi:pimeloyl-ACP methyl ester carboxylesterase